MHPDALSDTYLKAKRYTIFFAAILVLTSVVGLSPDDQSNLMGWSVANPQYTQYVLFFVVLYYQWQLALFWDAQGQSIKALPQHSFDYRLSVLIAVASLLSLPLILLVRSFGWNLPGLETVEGKAPWWAIAGLILLPAATNGFYWSVFRPKLERSRDAAAIREDEILSVLTDYAWELVFNSTAYEQTAHARGSKEIIFRPNGDIAEGRNNNENTWRMNSGFLELLDVTGSVFSRFSYDAKTERFIHTNDVDTKSLKNQYILKRGRLYQT